MRIGSPLRPSFYISDRQFKANRQSDPRLFKIHKERNQVTCAFHPSEKITNFCKDPECLLPLCPKCIKIHSEEHSESGSFSTLQSIDECLEQAHQTYMNLFSDITRLQRVSFEIEESYKKKKQETMEDFKKVKKLAIEYFNALFNQYEDAIKLQLNKDERSFMEGLIKYHEYIGKVMEKCRVGTKKLSNKHLLMQGLISFYMEQQIRDELKKCEEELNNYSIQKIQVYSNDHELQNIDTVIRNYMKFGNDQGRIQSLRIGVQMDKETNSPTNRTNKQYRESDRKSYPQSDSPRSFGGNLEKSHLISMESPLDRYSLERSRNIRMNISHKKSSAY